jgi:3-oxoacyl-[acyl-carrier protein] reductase
VELGLRGRTAVVCGSTKGIGRGIAATLAAEGVNIGVAARSQDGVDETVAALVDAGGQAVGVAADLSTRAGVERVVATTRDTFGPIDIAVSNITPPPHRYRLDDCTDDDFMDHHAALLMHVVWVTRAVVDDMRAAGRGRLVNIGSVVAKEWNPETPIVLSHTYRPAVLGFQKSMALELGPSGITVNTLGLGTFRTERMKESFLDRNPQLDDITWDELEPMRAQAIPARRLGRPEDVGALVAFLCSDHAAFITGQHYMVDGGFVRSL